MLGTRLGAIDKEPKADTNAMVYNIVGLFRYCIILTSMCLKLSNDIKYMRLSFRSMQKLMFDLPFYKYIRTPMWSRFESHCDKAIDAGLRIVNQVTGSN